MGPFTVGDIEILPVSDGSIIFNRSEFFDTVPDIDWAPYPEYASGKINMNVGSFILKSNEKTILVDTGLGKLDHHLEQPVKETLLAEIKKTGVNLCEIDIVFMTHLHTDHVGTNMTKTDEGWKATFQNARYMVHQKDWDLFGARVNSKPFEYLKEQICPLVESGSLDFFTGEIHLTKNISTFETPGHTPGHTSLLIQSKSEMAMILGDALHVPPQVNETHWSPRADRNKTLSTKSRKKLLELLEKQNGMLVSGHFPKPGLGRIKSNRSKKIYEPL